MLLNLQILYDRLDESYGAKCQERHGSDMYLRAPMLFDSQNVQADQLYVCLADELPAEPPLCEGLALCCIGDAPESYRDAPISLLEVAPHVDIKVLFNEIQHLYFFFDDWQSELDRCKTLPAICWKMLEKSAEVFGDSLGFMDADFQMEYYADAESQGRAESGTSAPDVRASIPDEMVKRLKADPLYDRIRGLREPFLFPAGILPFKLLCLNIFEDEEFLGSLIVGDEQYAPTLGDSFLLKYLARQFQPLFLSLLFDKGGRRQDLKDALFLVLDQDCDGEAKMREAVCKNQWDISDDFICLRIAIPQRERHNQTAGHLCQQIERAFPFCCAIEYDDEIAALADLSLNDRGENWFLENMDALLGKARSEASYGGPFRGLASIGTYYRQAELTMQMHRESRERRGPYANICSFENYKLDFLLRNCSGDLPSASMIAPGVMALILYDEKTGSDYFKTLYQFLLCSRNITHAAKDLGIHRGTLLYRLQRIKEIADLSWEETQDAFMLLLSCFLHQEQADGRPV